MSQRILVTGHRGYIGSVLVPVFRQAGYDVMGLDTDYFGECTLVPDPEEIPALRKDLRDLEPEDVAGFHAVVHLGALSNDPIGNLNPSWTDDINYRASVRLATLARDAGVARFLFSSSCIMYGMSEAQEVTEESPLDPQTDYARSKVKSEQAISTLATDRFSPTFLRNGTVYGLSPRMRFDTVLNDLVGRAITTGRVVVHSDGTPWRPVVHVQDVARLFLAVLEAPRPLVHNQAINAGAAELNRQILELAELVAAAVPGCVVDLMPQPGADQRTYRANFAKLGRLLPDFRFRYPPAEGARELVSAFRAIGLTQEHFTDQRFTRLRWLRHLRASGLLDGSLRWSRVEAAAV